MPRHRAVSDAEITKAARKIFLEHGTQSPVALVAQELGVSPATLFVRMGSKKRLITAALWPPDPPVLDVLERGVGSAVPVERQLRTIVADLARYVEEEIPATFTLYAAGLRAKPGEDFSDATPARLRRALAKWLKLAFPDGRMACPPRTVAAFIIGALEARVMHAFIGKKPLPASETRAFVGSLVALTVTPAKAYK